MSHRFVTELQVMSGVDMVFCGQDRPVIALYPQMLRRCIWIDAKVIVAIRVKPVKGGAPWNHLPLGRRAERVPLSSDHVFRLAPSGVLHAPITTSSRH